MNKDYGVIPKASDDHADHVGHGACVAYAAFGRIARRRPEYVLSPPLVVTQLRLGVEWGKS